MSDENTTETPVTPDAPISENSPAGSGDAAPAASEGTDGGGQDAGSAPVVPQKYKFKVKVNGKEEEKEYEESQLIAEIQRARAGDEAMRQRAEAEKRLEHLTSQYTQALEAFKKDPSLLYKDNPDEYVNKAEDLVAERFLMSKMTPEQKELYELKKDKERIERDKREIYEYRQRQATEEKQKEIFETTARTVNSALSDLKARGMPVTPFHAQLSLMYVRNADKKGIDIQPAELSQMVEMDANEITQGHLRGLPMEKAVTLLGDDFFKKYAEYIKAKVPKPSSGGESQSLTDEQKADLERRKKDIKGMSTAEYLRGLDKKMMTVGFGTSDE